MASGPVLHSLLLPGDEPGADALLELAVASGRHPDRDLLYGDEVRQSPVSKEMEPFFKPDFSPDLLLSTNYIGRPWAATAALLAKTGATPASLIADGEYDLLLRCAERATGVHHVPRLLCQRSAMELDDPGLEQAALERALDRRGIAGAGPGDPDPGHLAGQAGGAVARARFPSSSRPAPRKAISRPASRACGRKTAYRDFEIVCVDNIPQVRDGLEGLAAAECRQGHRHPRTHSTGRCSTTARPRSRTANSCCS